MKLNYLWSTLLLAMVFGVASCSSDKDEKGGFDPTVVLLAMQQQEHQQFQEAFTQVFGAVDSDVDWGFSETATRSVDMTTRAASLTDEEVLQLPTGDIELLTEGEKRAYLRQLADADLVAQLDIRQLRAYGFKRIIGEDLSVSANSDFDYNDVVFDAKRVDDAGSGDFATYYIILRATGAWKQIVVGNAEGAFEVHELFGCEKQETFVNTVNKERGTDTGAYWDTDHDPVFTKIKVAKKADGTEPLLIDIPIYAEGNTLPLTAVKGQPAEKMCVDTDYSWLEEKKHMQQWYPTFSHYVSGNASSEGDTYDSETSWWHYTYWDNEDYTNAVDEIVPQDVLQKITKYVPIYRGNTATLPEKAFSFLPYTAIYCSDNGFRKDQEVTNGDNRFYNFNSEAQTADYHRVEYTIGSKSKVAWDKAEGVSVSGFDNNFTLCFVTDGALGTTKTKIATILSGTVTPTGIKNPYYAITMLESSNTNVTMGIGEFRSFRDKDGFAEYVDWIWGD